MIQLGGHAEDTSGQSTVSYLGEYGDYEPQIDFAKYLAMMIGQGKAQQDDLWGGSKYAKKFGAGLFGFDPFSIANSTPHTRPPGSPEVEGAGGPPRGPVQTGPGGTRGPGTWTPIADPPTRTATPAGGPEVPVRGGGGGGGGGGGDTDPGAGGGQPPGGGGGGGINEPTPYVPEPPRGKEPPFDTTKPNAIVGPGFGGMSPEEYMARWNSYRRTA